MVVAVTCYGMATFEGPMLSLKSVNVISHFTDWTIAHVHVGGLGWNGMLTFGMLYWLFPRMYKTKLWSERSANIHFWLATLGIVLYVVPIYWAGFVQGFMWQDFNADGTLVHKEFLETVTSLKFMYLSRVVGGTLYIIGALMMTWNLMKTAASGSLAKNEEAEAPALPAFVASKSGEYWHRVIERKPIRMLVH